jgi:hypothetical protein
MRKSKLLDRTVVALAIVGLLAVGGGIWFEKSVATHLGFTLWWVAFSAVVIENYVSGRPVQTRGGVVRREDGAFRYALPFLVFGVMIVLSAIMLLAAWLMP